MTPQVMHSGASDAVPVRASSSSAEECTLAGAWCVAAGAAGAVVYSVSMTMSSSMAGAVPPYVAATVAARSSAV